ncbi:MAG: hypothetical protein RMJ98_18555, partial [Myxococcales bacterium]|nr:hypothetical protein [Polyangiaceae bacterium]MDW8251301.1 hypothetical protein [Myxococcales bacterium]
VTPKSGPSPGTLSGNQEDRSPSPVLDPGSRMAIHGGLDLDTGEGGDAEAEARAEQLTEQVRADPTNLTVVLELAGLLEQLGRDMDLFALLSARLEEGNEETRSALLPLQRAVLQRLAAQARQQGRLGEADLYEQMLTMFSRP